MYASEVMVRGPVEVAVCVDRGSLVDIDGDNELIAGVVVMQEEETKRNEVGHGNQGWSVNDKEGRQIHEIVGGNAEGVSGTRVYI